MIKRLVEYSSDEELDENNQHDKDSPLENIAFDCGKHSKLREKLPLPLEIQALYKDESAEKKKDSSLHGGRIRSFPHERGVWASYVFIQYNPSSEFFEMIEDCKTLSKDHGIDLDIVDSFHISLSKTVKLRHHWISPFIDSLKVQLCNLFWFSLTFQSLEVYENEEKTRTFIGLKIHVGYESLLKLTKQVDKCLADFQLPCFYENPSFHMSFVSCVGSKSTIIESFMADLNVLFQSFLESNPGYKKMVVTKICCKSGNKLYAIDLKTNAV